MFQTSGTITRTRDDGLPGGGVSAATLLILKLGNRQKCKAIGRSDVGIDLWTWKIYVPVNVSMP